VAVEVTAQQVKELRDATGAGFQDCRKALLENGGDLAKATDFLRKKGIARKGLEMFRQVRVPVLGIVENMSYFEPAPGQRHYLFGQGGGRKMAGEAGVPFLGEVPIDPRVTECGDQGEPIVQRYPDSAVAQAYSRLAEVVAAEAGKANEQEQLPEVEL